MGCCSRDFKQRSHLFRKIEATIILSKELNNWFGPKQLSSLWNSSDQKTNSYSTSYKRGLLYNFVRNHQESKRKSELYRLIRVKKVQKWDHMRRHVAFKVERDPLVWFAFWLAHDVNCEVCLLELRSKHGCSSLSEAYYAPNTMEWHHLSRLIP